MILQTIIRNEPRYLRLTKFICLRTSGLDSHFDIKICTQLLTTRLKIESNVRTSCLFDRFLVSQIKRYLINPHIPFFYDEMLFKIIKHCTKLVELAILLIKNVGMLNTINKNIPKLIIIGKFILTKDKESIIIIE